MRREKNFLVVVVVVVVNKRKMWEREVIDGEDFGEDESLVFSLNFDPEVPFFGNLLLNVVDCVYKYYWAKIEKTNKELGIILKFQKYAKRW